MADELKEILEQVAEGSLTVEQADEAIAHLASATPELEPAPEEPAQRILIKGGAVKLTVIGDPNVAEAVADGPARFTRDGETLVVDTSADEGDYSVEPPRSAFMSWLTQVINKANNPLEVRVNPELPIQVLIVGGALDLSGVTSGASIGVEAGAAKVHDGSGPLLLDIASGSAKVDWTFSGESRVRVDMGSAVVNPRPDSDVAITVEASTGQAIIKHGLETLKAPPNDPAPTATVGSGTGTLQVRARLGSAQVNLGG